MFDIHCHVLPNMDDGARDLEDSLEMCSIFVKNRVKTIAATPHFIENESEAQIPAIEERIASITKELEDKDIKINIVPGMEVFITPNLVDLYEEKKIITLNNKGYLLVELPLFESLPPYLEDVLFNLQIKGLKTVIAHPERCRIVQEHPNTAYRLVERGCLLQVNSSSIEGLHSRKAKKTVDLLLNHRMVHAVASDSHSSRGRIALLSESYKIVAKGCGEDYAKKLYFDNPMNILAGNEVEVGEPTRIEKKLFWRV